MKFLLTSAYEEYVLYFVGRVRCRRKKIHVRCLISWWAFC